MAVLDSKTQEQIDNLADLEYDKLQENEKDNGYDKKL